MASARRAARRRRLAGGSTAAALLAAALLSVARAPATGAPRPGQLTDGVGLALVRIPGGEFLMGSPEIDLALARFPRSAPPEEDDLQTEKPQHRVRVSRAFYMSATEITVGQFKRFVAATHYVTDAEKAGPGGRGFNQRGGPGGKTGAFETSPRYTWKNPGFPQRDDHPVVVVSWNDATAFTAWLSREEKAVYRLPTEAEWEYACRAGSETWLDFGDDPANAHRHANLADVSLEKAHPGHAARQRLVDLDHDGDDGYVFTAPVGHYEPNAFGLYDMHGNVWEWCRDHFRRSYYRQGNPKVAVVDPQGPDASDDGGNLRSLRGGSWYVDVLIARATSRLWDAPGDSFSYAGFRVVREL